MVDEAKMKKTWILWQTGCLNPNRVRCRHMVCHHTSFPTLR